MSFTIRSGASGSCTPPIVMFPEELTNGDFTVKANSESVPVVGDGINERTCWTFNFTGDDNWNAFDSSKPITGARLTLILVPKNQLITTDVVKVEGLGFIKTPKIQNLPVGEIAKVCLELLDHYSERELRAQVNNGAVDMVYADDAIVCSATLEITQNCPRYQYAVKYICGEFGKEEILSPGNYLTAINIHNPNYETVRFRYKVASALPGQPGTVSRFKRAYLRPDYAMEIDCPQIRELLNAPDRKGFVVIETDQELDIVAVYSAGTPEVSSLHMERVEPRIRRSSRPPKCPPILSFPNDVTAPDTAEL